MLQLPDQPAQLSLLCPSSNIPHLCLALLYQWADDVDLAAFSYLTVHVLIHLRRGRREMGRCVPMAAQQANSGSAKGQQHAGRS